MDMTLQEAVSARQEELLRTLQESIRIRSVQAPAEEGCPYGPGVRRCLDHALETARGLGLKAVDMDHQAGWCEYGEGEEMVAVLGHLDVVPEGDGWSFDPFGGEIRDGKVFGRGSMDDKGPTVAALYALAAIRDAGLPLRRRIRLLLGTNEETGSQDMKYYRAHGGELPVMGFTPDGEYPVINGEKGIVNMTFRRTYAQSGAVRIKRIGGGSAPNVVPAHARAEIVCPPELAEQWMAAPAEKLRVSETADGMLVEAEGVSAHGASPQEGENALGRLVRALTALPLAEDAGAAVRFLAEKLGMETDGAARGAALRDEVSGPLPLNWGTLEGDDTSLSLTINFRYPVTKTYEDCGPAVRAAFEGAGFTLEREVHKPCLYIPQSSELVQTLLRVYAEKTGLPAAPKSIGGGTYAKAIPNVVAFGPIFPGDEVREHKPDEFIEVDKLMKNAQIIAEAMYQLAK